MRFVHLAALLCWVGLLAGCDLGVEKGLGSWDCNHAHWSDVTIWPTRMTLQTDSGTLTATGYWKNDGFWCSDPNGGADYEAAKVLPDDQLTLQAKAFEPGSVETVMCYKSFPGYDEGLQLNAESKTPVTYPPPKGAIKVGMTEYRLTILPWHASQIIHEDDDHNPVIYQFPSNDPNKAPLSVSVQNHRVISLNGGNE